VLFLVFSIPCFFWVPESPARRLPPGERPSVLRTLRRLPRDRPLFLFLVANLCAVDVLNTAIIWTPRYLTGVFQLEGTWLAVALLAVNIGALVAGILVGRLADRLGARTAFVLSIVSLGVALLAAGSELSRWTFLCTFVFFGAVGLAGIWTAGRKLLCVLAPPERIGEYFGIYGITQKVSMVGVNVVALLVDWSPTPEGYRFAIGTQLIPLGLALWLALRIRMPDGGEPGTA